MIETATESMACPLCHSTLTLIQVKHRDGKIWKGKIVCTKSGHEFSVVTGIPIMLPPGMLAGWTQPFTKILVGDLRPDRNQKRRMIDPLAEYVKKHGIQKMKDTFSAFVKGEYQHPTKYWECPVDDTMIREGAYRKRRDHVDRQLQRIDDRWGKDKSLREHVKSVAQLKPKRLVDVCCGGGFFTTSLLKIYREYDTLFTLDIDFKVTRLLESIFDHYGVSTRSIPLAADVRTLPFSIESFDLVTSRYGSVHVMGYSEGLKEMFRILEPGGYFVSTNRIHRKIPHKALSMEDIVQITKHADLFLDKEDYLQTLAKTGFEVEKVKDIENAFLAICKKPNPSRK